MQSTFKNLLYVLRHYKLATVTNLLGLSFAFLLFMLISIHVGHEYSFDASLLNRERIFQLENKRDDGIWEANFARPQLERFIAASPYIEAAAITNNLVYSSVRFGISASEGPDARSYMEQVERMEAAGYRDGKFYGKSPAEMKKYLADLGARMVGSHTGSGLLAEGDTKGWDFWKKNAADTAEVGCKWIVQAGYPSKDIKSLSDVKRLADQFNKCGEIAKANGLRFAFHNHVDEFHELEGKIPFDVMIENTDKGLVTFQIDTAQLVYGGFKCHDYVNRYPGRFANWHLKDANADGKGSTEMGAGIVDFKSLFAVAEKAGLEDYFIEQERYNMTPLQAMKHDYDFLMNASYVKW
jgi:sugar phosphate isomerase/epimerase